jgi:hypothetical protein
MARFVVGSHSFRSFAVSFISLLIASNAFAQVTAVTGDQAPPIPGAGHDYIHLLSETVNPATGSVSIRVGVPVPPGRGLAVPFFFGYDSNDEHLFTPPPIKYPDNTSYLAQGGWTYLMPHLNMIQQKNVDEYSTTPPEFSTCYAYLDFLFTDLGGQFHSLGLSTAQQPGLACVNNYKPQYLNGTDGLYQAIAGDGGQTQNPTPVTVADHDGTVYYFSNTYGSRVHLGVNSGWASIPDWIEDRNGNKITISDNGGGAFAITDTLGRVALSSSGFGVTGNTLNISGLSQPYNVTWGVSSSNWYYNAVVWNEGINQCKIGSGTYQFSLPEITQIKLPNNQVYQFQYDSTSGLLNKVVYPSGGYVRYMWGTNSLSDTVDYYDDTQTSGSPFCRDQHDTQAVADRYVSFDGVREILHQHFVYGTTWKVQNNWPTWTSKTATVTTYDLQRGTNFQTVYQYGPMSVVPQPNDPTSFGGGVMPVEQSVAYL